jgi:type I site-specific restriction endonuclease
METKATVWDPLRKKEVALTPEERVRQWCIGVLNNDFGVPMHMMMSEAGFRLGDKQFRADILVYDRCARPLLVVECKRPQVELTAEVLDQAIRYNMVLNVPYIFITNGTRTIVCRRKEQDGRIGYEFMDKAPTYNEMLNCHSEQ